MEKGLTTSQKLKQEAKIGEILLSQTSLSEAQLREALAIQKEKGGKLGDILIQKKFLQPHEIIIALSLQVGIPYLKEIEVNSINPDWVQDIPITYARQMEILPIAMDDVAVTVSDASRIPRVFKFLPRSSRIFHVAGTVIVFGGVVKAISHNSSNFSKRQLRLCMSILLIPKIHR